MASDIDGILLEIWPMFVLADSTAHEMELYDVGHCKSFCWTVWHKLTWHLLGLSAHLLAS